MLSPQKVVAVAYERWSFTRGSNCRLLTGKNLVFWIGGRLREVVARGGSTIRTLKLASVPSLAKSRLQCLIATPLTRINHSLIMENAVPGKIYAQPHILIVHTIFTGNNRDTIECLWDHFCFVPRSFSISSFQTLQIWGPKYGKSNLSLALKCLKLSEKGGKTAHFNRVHIGSS